VRPGSLITSRLLDAPQLMWKYVVRTTEAALDYSLADVVKMSGGKRRSVQLWAEAGAIQAFSRTDKRGTGTHRRFSRDEVIIACCLNGLARRQVGIGELMRIGRGLRKFLHSGDTRTQVEDAIFTKKAWEYYLFIIWEEERDPYVLMLDEPEFTQEITARVKGRGLLIILPLKKYLAGMRA
jgi:hypothetical protein